MLRMLLLRLFANQVASRLPVQRPSITWRQKLIALAIAGMIDFIQIVLFPFFLFGMLQPTQWGLDIFACIALMLICGGRWQFAMAFLVELIPGMSLFPTWTAFVIGMPTRRIGPVQPLRLDPRRTVQVIDTRVRPSGA